MSCEHTTLIVSAPTYDQCVFCELAQLRADLARVTAELDAAERDTAEQIAAWLDERRSPYLSRGGLDRDDHVALLREIRAGAWRKVQP